MAESQSSANNFLTVDECVRPRANSDPTAGAWCKGPSLVLPEITVEDCTDSELCDINPHAPAATGTFSTGGCMREGFNPSLDQGGLFGVDATPRRRANTCPEDLFRKRNGRPPTPPPSTFRRGSKCRPGLKKPVLCQSVSFVHHKLSKLTEDTSEVHSHAAPPLTEVSERLSSDTSTAAPNASANGTSVAQNAFSTATSGQTPKDCTNGSALDDNTTADHSTTAEHSTTAGDRTVSEDCTNVSTNLQARFTDESTSATYTESTSHISGQSAKTESGPQRAEDKLSAAGKAFKDATRAEDGLPSDAEGSSGTDAHYRAKSSVDCRYSRMSKPRGLDGAQLQAC